MNLIILVLSIAVSKIVSSSIIFIDDISSVEKLEVVKEWETPENDGLVYCISENKFFTSSTLSFGISVIEKKNEDFEMKEIYRIKYEGVKDEYDFEKQFISILILNEKSFIGCTFNSVLAVIECN